jgi:hypothetical protein
MLEEWKILDIQNIILTTALLEGEDLDEYSSLQGQLQTSYCWK